MEGESEGDGESGVMVVKCCVMLWSSLLSLPLV